MVEPSRGQFLYHALLPRSHREWFEQCAPRASSPLADENVEGRHVVSLWVLAILVLDVAMGLWMYVIFAERTFADLPDVDPNAPSQELDDAVRAQSATGGPIYKVYNDTVVQLRPDVIITQEQCRICAVTPEDVEAACAALPSVQLGAFQNRIFQNLKISEVCILYVVKKR